MYIQIHLLELCCILLKQIKNKRQWKHYIISALKRLRVQLNGSGNLLQQTAEQNYIHITYDHRAIVCHHNVPCKCGFARKNARIIQKKK